MSTNKHFIAQLLPVILCLLLPFYVFARLEKSTASATPAVTGELILLGLLMLAILIAAMFLLNKTREMMRLARWKMKREDEDKAENYIHSFDSKQIETYLKYKQTNKPKSSGNNLVPFLFMMVGASFYSTGLFAQSSTKAPVTLFGEGGFVITLILILTPILAGIILVIMKVANMIKRYRRAQNLAEISRITEYLKTFPEKEITDVLRKRKAVLDYKLSQNELSGSSPVNNDKGIISNVNEHANIRFIAEKRKALKRPDVNPEL